MNKAFMRIEEAPAGAAGGGRLRHRTGRPFAGEAEIYSLTVTVTRP